MLILYHFHIIPAKHILIVYNSCICISIITIKPYVGYQQFIVITPKVSVITSQYGNNLTIFGEYYNSIYSCIHEDCQTMLLISNTELEIIAITSSCQMHLPALLLVKIWWNWFKVVPSFKLHPPCLEHWWSDDNDNYIHFVDRISKVWTVWLSHALLETSRQSDRMISFKNRCYFALPDFLP